MVKHIEKAIFWNKDIFSGQFKFETFKPTIYISNNLPLIVYKAS